MVFRKEMRIVTAANDILVKQEAYYAHALSTVICFDIIALCSKLKGPSCVAAAAPYF